MTHKTEDLIVRGFILLVVLFVFLLVSGVVGCGRRASEVNSANGNIVFCTPANPGAWMCFAELSDGTGCAFLFDDFGRIIREECHGGGE